MVEPNFHRRILKAGLGRMSKATPTATPKTFHERESQNLSPVHVSLDNADTVIEGGPGFRECDKSHSGAPLFRVLCERVGGSAEMLRAAIFIGGPCARNIHAGPDSFLLN